MAGIVCNEGYVAILTALVRSGLTLRLFANDRRPHVRDRRQDYHEAAVLGYAPVPLDPARFTITAPMHAKDGDTPARAVFDEVEWIFGQPAGGFIYGYYITTADGTVVAVERFDHPFEVVNRRDRLAIIPVLVHGPSRRP